MKYAGSAPSLAARKRERNVWRYFTYDRSKDSRRYNIVDAKTKSTCVQIILFISIHIILILSITRIHMHSVRLFIYRWTYSVS